VQATFFEHTNPKREIAGRSRGNRPCGDGALARPSIHKRFRQLMAEEKIDQKAALKKVAKERGLSKSEAYREMQRGN